MIARNTFYLTSALIGQKILSFIYFTLLARFLGAEAIGKYTFALAFTTIFSILTDLGLTPVLIREVARSREKIEKFIQTIFGVKLILGFVAYFVVLITAYLLGHSILTIELIALAGIVMFLDTFHLSFYGILRGLQVLKYEAIGMVTGQAITLAGGFIALAFGLPLHVFLIALGFGSLYNAIFSFVIIKRRKISLFPNIEKTSLRILTRLAVPFALAGIFTKVYSYIDTVLLEHFKGDLAVGWYSVPYKITYAFQILPMALSAAIFPAFSKSWKENKVHARHIFDQGLIYGIIASLPIVFGIASLAPEIMLSVYGADFANSVLPLKISVFGLIFIFLYFPVGALLNATDRQTVNTTFMGIAMLANIILNIILIPSLGAVGASIAAVLTNALLFLGTLFWTCSFMPPSRLVPKTFFKALVSVLIMAFVVLELKQIVFWPVTIFIGAGVYVGLIMLFKAVTRKEVHKVIKLIKS